jgi:hypothetical protein
MNGLMKGNRDEFMSVAMQLLTVIVKGPEPHLKAVSVQMVW